MSTGSILSILASPQYGYHLVYDTGLSLVHCSYLSVGSLQADKDKVLRLIDYNKPNMIWLFTDASPTGTGAWIGQGPTRDAARPAPFHSRKLTPSQSNYPTHQQETLAIIEGMKAFAPHFLHRQFTVVTAHASLTKLMTQKNLNG